MSNFANLKKNAAARQEALISKLNEQKGKSYKDDRFWTLSKDKVGNGYAVIRFLSSADGEDCPWVQVWSHSIQGKGGWFIENCPTTLEQKCPVKQAA